MARRSSINQRRLSRLLRRAPEEVRIPVKEAIADAAQTLVIAARENAPVDQGVLRESITGRLSRSGLSADVGILGKRNQRNAFYGVFVEFGTKGAPAKNIPPMPPQPYLVPALEQNKAEIIRSIDKAVDEALEKLSRG